MVVKKKKTSKMKIYTLNHLPTYFHHHKITFLHLFKVLRIFFSTRKRLKQYKLMISPTKPAEKLALTNH